MNQHTNPDREARNILVANDRGGYTIPTEGLYPYQWNWDSAIAALGFAEFDIDRAWTEIETLFTGQWDDGMVPHILFHKQDDGYFPGPDVWGGHGPIPSSGIIQPPVAATVARKIWEQDGDAGEDRIRALFPALLAWHRWIMKWRLDDHGAVCTTHPWEAGRDNAPDWDKAMEGVDPTGVGEYKRRDTSHVNSADRPTKYDYDRYIKLVQVGRQVNWDQQKLLSLNPFRVADPTMTFITLRAARDLLVISENLGIAADGLSEDIQKLDAGARSLWNEALNSFDARDERTGEWAESVSNASYLCWYAGLDSQPMLERLQAILENVPYPVPSYDPSMPKFDQRRYWRGPTWGFMNMLIGFGLADMGHLTEAEALRQKTAQLIATNGFAEYYDPLSGSPAGGNSFTWTAAVWLHWAGRK